MSLYDDNIGGCGCGGAPTIGTGVREIQTSDPLSSMWREVRSSRLGFQGEKHGEPDNLSTSIGAAVSQRSKDSMVFVGIAAALFLVASRRKRGRGERVSILRRTGRLSEE